MSYYCYILRNNYPDHINRTYNGYTTNLTRRLRQHNQEIKGGAKYTSRFGNQSWEYMIIVTGLSDKITALQLEWKIKHPDGRRIRNRKYNSPKGRIIGLIDVFKKYQYDVKIYCHNDYYKFLKKSLKNQQINLKIKLLKN